ncbi:MAG: hypothetical protein GF383_02235 [Candidatus Lokiarchaeota archaeon]|nr:hypothetical protein [Candidatus Lokiarchaeota archaeon]MBD3338233.1 hypothetical protein [Candidatus Lokiarchaeota archaeon]
MNKFSKKNPPSFYFIGHFAIDTIIRFKITNKPTLGGSVSYCSLALRKYANAVKISIISNLGKSNFDDSLLKKIRQNDINLKGCKWFDVDNTNFVLDYYNHSRTLTLRSKSPDLKFEDLPSFLVNNSPDVIVLVPLCNEITYDYVSKIIKNFPDSYIGIDLQGFIRKIENGKVSLERDEDVLNNMEKVIDLIGDKLILKGSEEEMKLLSGEQDLYKTMEYFRKFQNNAIFIMTLGDKGSLIIKKDEDILNIPAFQAKEVVDETGAGDVYLSIFLYEFVKSHKTWNEVKKAGLYASAAASFLLEKKGPNGFESKKKVIKRLNSKKTLS